MANDSSSNHNYKVSVTAQEVNGILNIGAWDYGSVPDMSGTFKSFSISWRGYNSKGKAISGSGTPTIKKQSTTYMSADLPTDLDFGYTGSATGTLVTKYGTYTSKATWGRGTPSAPSEQKGSISITSFYVDNGSTTGMVDGKYVIGTKLCFKATIQSTYATKTCRYILTGAKESDNTWELYGSKTADAYSIAVATGIIYVKCIVTDVKGNQAQKELQVKIESEKEDNYYAYYFFGNKFKDSFSKEIHSISITLYNIYNDAVSEPQGKTIECYAHNFKTFNNIKNQKHNDGALTHITTFVVPDIKNISHATFALTEAEMKTLMKYNGGLAFKIRSQNCLTVHDVKCSIDIVFK